MTTISQLPRVTSITDQSLFLVTENGVTKVTTWTFIKSNIIGFSGSRGSQGFVGSIGFIGYTGSQLGYIGSTGYRGSAGYQGSTGYTGSASGYGGSRGVTGYNGSQGIFGFTGSRSDIGYTGSTIIGFGGSSGITGFIGSKGDRGDPNGYTGSSGSPGTPGIPGGYTGSNGAIGGTSFVFQNSGYNYSVDGFADTTFPTLTVVRGQLYYFNLTNISSSHPLALRLISAPTTGFTSAVPGTTGNNPSAGVYGDGATLTIVTYQVPFNAPSTIFYQCVAHPSMIGTINVIDQAGYTGSASTGIGFSGSQGAGFIGSRGTFGYTGSGGSGGGSVGLTTRGPVVGTTTTLSPNSGTVLTVTGYKSYALMTIATSASAWVRVYTSDAARTSDSNRTQGNDPTPGNGVIAEVITTGATSQIISPATIGWNESGTSVCMAVTNLSGASAAITVTLTILQLEA